MKESVSFSSSLSFEKKKGEAEGLGKKAGEGALEKGAKELIDAARK